MAKKPASAAAFKSALEARLRKKAQDQGVPFSTLQLKYVMERLLARLLRSGWSMRSGRPCPLETLPAPAELCRLTPTWDHSRHTSRITAARLPFPTVRPPCCRPDTRAYGSRHT
jgi:hypothetical protein